MTVPMLAHFGPLATGYDALLCDVWGVVHNGVRAFAAAGDALVRFRAAGKAVILITNAPRPGAVVTPLLDQLGVPRAAYDGIVSSGDVTRGLVAARGPQRIFHIGPGRDLPIFDDLDLAFAPAERADYVVCTGLFDDTVETPEDYRPLLETLRARGLAMICANPDVVVSRGDALVYCAGAVADLYAEMGGEVVYAGKPHRPIYERAAAAAAQALDRTLAPGRILAIGDSIRTDLAGAQHFGIDCLFVTAGIHAEEFAADSAASAAFAQAGVTPKAMMRALSW